MQRFAKNAGRSTNGLRERKRNGMYPSDDKKKEEKKSSVNKEIIERQVF